MVKKICITSLKVTVGKSEKNFVPHGGKAPIIPSFPPHGGKAPVIPSFCSTFSKSGFLKGMVYNNQGINNGKSSLTKVACPSRDQ